MLRTSLIVIALSVLALAALGAAVAQAKPSVGTLVRQSDAPPPPPPTRQPPPPTMVPPPSDGARTGGPNQAGEPRGEGGQADRHNEESHECRAAAPTPPPTPTGQGGSAAAPPPLPPPPPPDCHDSDAGSGKGPVGQANAQSDGYGSGGSAASAPVSTNGFALTSPAVQEGGDLPRQFTCDGASDTLPLAWTGAPTETRSYAVVMHHIPGPGDTHWYWVLYDIPPDVTSLPTSVSGIGTLGNNSVNGKTAYAPPCSKGPGAKVYTYTVYALSAQPVLAVEPSQVSRDVLLAAIQDRTLASATLNVAYTR
jgi:phosphatidylethanolamine-binding protein (PEBP) family uncharacterized protein